MALPRQSGKKTTIPPKPNAAQQIVQLDQFVTGATSEPSTIAQVSTPNLETPIEILTPLAKPSGTDLEPEKSKIKRLTLDINEELHKAIKMKSVSLGIPMVDMLRKLLESNYGNL